MGVRKGLSDYLVLLPADRCINRKGGVLFIEMKRKGRILKIASSRGKAGDTVPLGTATPEQLEFLAMVDLIPNVAGKVCNGCDEAIAFVKQKLLPSGIE